MQHSMENFFNWITKPIPQDEVIVWFNIHNMTYEKIELYGDISKSLTKIIMDTYLGESIFETKITLSDEDNIAHFDWCWKEMVKNFKKENIEIKLDGEHKEYFQSFFEDTFYNQPKESIKQSIDAFLDEIFDTDVTFSKSDLDLLTELYKLMEKNIE
jgi:hypothetical protein